jgi:molybdopterin-guanine dinucleotide biosynthesis protein A
MLDLVTIDEDVVRGLDPKLESFWNLNTPEDIALAELKMARRAV